MFLAAGWCSDMHVFAAPLASVFGVGLDDTFIITGAYFRTDPDKEPAERIREAMQDIGLSISVTTITTMFAFILGCMSTIPAIYWLNLYAFPTILIDYLFQTTFFVGEF